MILDDTAGAEVVAMKIQVLDSMVAAQGAVGVVQHTRFLDNTAAAAAEAGRSKVAGVLVVHLLQDRDGGGGRRGTPSSLFFFLDSVSTLSISNLGFFLVTNNYALELFLLPFSFFWVKLPFNHLKNVYITKFSVAYFLI